MRKISKEKLISELQECFEKHNRVNRRIFNEDSQFSSGKTVYNKFGSFSNACEEAGVPHDNKPQKKDKIEVECKNCKKTKLVYPYRLKENSNDRFFCDNECQGQWWSDNLTGEDHPLYKGGGEWKNKLGAKWHKYRDKCLDRDGYSCQICGITESEHIERHKFGLDVHHIEPRRKFYNDSDKSMNEANKMENLITLCRKHHVQIENGNIKMEED
jgi:ribosomal protein L44E